MSGKSYVVMGVSSSGKSSIGAALAQRLGAKFIDGDDLHPRANIVKMGGGTPLDDDDRAPWLERINDAVFSVDRKNETAVIVCSALKKAYRDRIRKDNDKLTFVFMEGSYALILERMKARQGHFQKAGMLQSQFDALEAPGDDEPDVIHVSVDGDFDTVLARTLAAVQAGQ
ncbi:gluconokinase [Jeongeupia sp. USM3]|uniref:gluconokinase n=1 Tax=Jeongeupia sp. USM3 TaxID=1906741 RepID=UPI00089DDE68|nr:gluconokinase [Jeongeupia sp. USM3]AOX99275.1 gluconate kinase [Jeongeupia sp. USM3]